MSINAISSFGFLAVTACKKTQLSPETIEKLKALGINPDNIKSEVEAQKIIAEEEAKNPKSTEKNAEAEQPQQAQISIKPDELLKEAKELGAKVGIPVTSMKDIESNIAAIEAKIDNIDTASGLKDFQTVQIKEDDLKSDLADVKTKLDEIKKAKSSMFAGQDMLAMMNKISLGL